MIITDSLIVPLIAVSTVATAIFIGLGFMPRPSRAGGMWAVGFATIMSATYLWAGHEVLESAQLRAIAVGLMFSPMALMWSGLRAFRDRPREYRWISIPTIFAMPLVLYATSYTSYYGITFRVVFALTGIFAALIIVELLRLGPGLRDEVLPLVLASSVYLVFVVVLIVEGILVARGAIGNPDSLLFIRTLNMIGAPVYIICFLVTTLLLTVKADAVGRSVSHAQFRSVAEDRLERAKAAADPWWSLLDIRLDDPDDIRTATSTADFNQVSARFVDQIRADLPPDADIEVMSPTRVIALVPRAQGGLREILTGLLEHISTVDPSEPVPIGISASVGWAHVTSVGYDLDALVTAAAGAARIAHDAGGDRWERVRGRE